VDKIFFNLDIGGGTISTRPKYCTHGHCGIYFYKSCNGLKNLIFKAGKYIGIQHQRGVTIFGGTRIFLRSRQARSLHIRRKFRLSGYFLINIFQIIILLAPELLGGGNYEIDAKKIDMWYDIIHFI
jgi:hypothetical protein